MTDQGNKPNGNDIGNGRYMTAAGSIRNPITMKTNISEDFFKPRAGDSKPESECSKPGQSQSQPKPEQEITNWPKRPSGSSVKPPAEPKNSRQNQQ